MLSLVISQVVVESRRIEVIKSCRFRGWEHRCAIVEATTSSSDIGVELSRRMGLAYTSDVALLECLDQLYAGYVWSRCASYSWQGISVNPVARFGEVNRVTDIREG
ncbi:hypothetical protein FS842_005803 [Serendipita sp. 407]|nr:hypothetical protein FS842_005803 [Serendipita sp. 407]